MRNSRMAVSLPADEAKECRPGEQVLEIQHRDTGSPLLSFLNSLSRERSLRYLSFSRTYRFQRICILDIWSLRTNKIIEENQYI